MNYTRIEKPEWKLLKHTLLGGTDGSLYVESSYQNILKLLYNFYGIEDKKRLLHLLIDLKELESLAAMPKELVYVEHLNKVGFWMTYYRDSMTLDIWTKRNKEHPQKVLKMYQKISETLKLLHDYGIIVSDCYYSNILIVSDSFPILVDVDSWSTEHIPSYTVSKILVHYARNMHLNRYQRYVYLKHSKSADNASLWLMYLEAACHFPVRKKRHFFHYLKGQEANPILYQICDRMNQPVLEDIPYFHEVSKQFTLHK